MQDDSYSRNERGSTSKMPIPYESFARSFTGHEIESGVVADPDGSVSKPYVIIAGMAVLVTIYAFIVDHYVPRAVISFLLPGLVIAYLFKISLWQTEQIRLASKTLRRMAVQPCDCKSTPQHEKMYCFVCDARDTLEDYFPENLVVE